MKLDFSHTFQDRTPAAAKQTARRSAETTATSGSRKLHLDFHPMVYMRDKTHSYLWLRDGYKFGYFLTMDSGVIEIVKLDIVTLELEPEVKADKKAGIKAKPAVTTEVYRVWIDREHTWDLMPCRYDFVKAVEKYHTSTLGRSAAAEREMRSILKLPQLAPTTTDADLAVEPQERKPKTAKAEPKAAAGYTLQALCDELKLEPSEARKTLRGAKIEKPGARWEWPNAEAAAAVRAALEAA